MFVIEKNRKAKPVCASSIEDQKIELLSSQSDPNNLFFGGRILQIVSKYAYNVAKNHAELDLKPLGIDNVRFFSTVSKDDVIQCKVAVNRVWKEKVEVGVKVIKEDFRLLEEKDVLSCYFTYEAIDEDENPIEDISDIIPESNDEKRRYAAAEKRKNNRKNTNFNIYR